MVPDQYAGPAELLEYLPDLPETPLELPEASAELLAALPDLLAGCRIYLNAIIGLGAVGAEET